MTPRQFCQEQLLLLGDEELPPDAQAASLEILHTTVMNDFDAETFEQRLTDIVNNGAPPNTPLGVAAQVAKVLLDEWHQELSLGR